MPAPKGATTCPSRLGYMAEAITSRVRYGLNEGHCVAGSGIAVLLLQVRQTIATFPARLRVPFRRTRMRSRDGERSGSSFGWPQYGHSKARAATTAARRTVWT